MTQSNFGTIDPYTKTGLALTTDLNAWRTAIHSAHSGAATPAYAPAGMNWIKTAAVPWLWSFFDAVDNITLQQIDTTNDYAIIDGVTLYAPAAVYPGAGPPASDLWYDHTLAGFSLPGLSTAIPLAQRDWEFIEKVQYSSTATAGFNIINLSAFRVLRLQLFVQSPDGAELRVKFSTDNGSTWNADTAIESVIESANNLGSSYQVIDYPQGTFAHARVGIMYYSQLTPIRQFYDIVMYEFNQAKTMEAHYFGGFMGVSGVMGCAISVGTFRRNTAVARNALQVTVPSPFMTKFWYHIEGIRS